MNEKSNERGAVFNAPKNPQILIDALYACALFLLCYFAVQIIQPFHMTLIDGILILCFLVISFLYARQQYPIHQAQYGLEIFIFFNILPNFFYDNDLLKFFNVLYILLLQSYFFLQASRKEIAGKPSEWILLDCLHISLRIPLIGFGKVISYVRTVLSGIHHKNLSSILIGVIVSIPFLCVILPLLMRSDDAFARVITDIAYMDILHWLLGLLPMIPLFLYLYSQSFGALRCEKEEVLSDPEDPYRLYLHQLAVVSKAVFLSMQCILCILYLSYLLIGWQDILSHLHASWQSFSYSSFARKGFFELCAISVINLGFLMVSQLLTKQQEAQKGYWMERILCIETLALIVTAMLKMALYVHQYGLSELRVYSSWFMIVLFGIFLLLAMRKKHVKTVFLKAVIYACVCFTMLNFINVNGLIEAYNTSMPIVVRPNHQGMDGL